MKQKFTFRKLINDLHLWVGLSSALVLTIMCFSGTMYVFQREITQFLNKDKFYVQPNQQATFLPINQLKDRVEQQTGGNVTSIQIAQHADEAWTFTVTAKEEKADTPKRKTKKEGTEKEKAKSLLVNPYTGTVQGDAKTPTSLFFASVLKLHRWLLIENKDIGGAITGAACLMMLFLQLSGFVLWLPAKLKSWKKWSVWETGFKIKWNASRKRLNFDLHKTLGFYAFLFITICALTGPYFALSWYKTGALSLLGQKAIRKDNPYESVVGTKVISLDEVVTRINSIYPYEGHIRITMPKGKTGSFSIQKYAEGFLTCSGIDRAELDQYSGAVLNLEKYSEQPLAKNLIYSAKAIHTGEIFGTFTKILYFLACLIATTLPTTGFYIWWNKRSKKDQKNVPGKSGSRRAPQRAAPVNLAARS
ncbi:MAG: PepSY-associated TM helix domain-containing protein [Siphonobacter sp.]